MDSQDRCSDTDKLGAKDSYRAIVLSAALFTVVAAQKLGALFDSSTAFKMKNGNKRSPDISFFAKERLRGLDDLPIGFLEGAPDLVIEILSPTNTIEEIDEKLNQEPRRKRTGYGIGSAPKPKDLDCRLFVFAAERRGI